jgi:hypothetical protein
MVEEAEELKQLNEFHEKLAALEPAAQASLLRNGFLPDSPDVLVEAGVRCLPLIESGDTHITDGAVDRLEAIVFKLRHGAESGGVRKMINELEAVLQKRRVQDRSDMRLGFGIILGLTLAAAVVVAAVLYLLLR